MRRLTLPFALLFVLAAGCGPLFQKPSASVKRVDITHVDFGGISFDIVFSVYNPNIIGLDLATLQYQLTVDNHRFVAGSTNRALHVPAEGTGELHVPLSFRFVELAEALVSLFQKPVVPYTIATTLGFGTPLGVINVPISHSGSFPVPRIPTVSLASAAVGNVNMRGADVEVLIRMQNTNSFASPINGLDYSLTLEGAPIASAGTGPVNLPPMASHDVPVRAHADFLQAGLGILRAVEARSATVALQGNLVLAGFTIPVNVSTRIQ